MIALFLLPGTSCLFALFFFYQNTWAVLHIEPLFTIDTTYNAVYSPGYFSRWLLTAALSRFTFSVYSIQAPSSLLIFFFFTASILTHFLFPRITKGEFWKWWKKDFKIQLTMSLLSLFQEENRGQRTLWSCVGSATRGQFMCFFFLYFQYMDFDILLRNTWKNWQ